MEKLVLRGIANYADKIPDSWFDRIPGNYYKSNPQAAPPRSDSRQERRRYSGDYNDSQSQYNDPYDRRDDDRRRDSHRSRSSYARDDRRYSVNDKPRRSYDDRAGYDDRYDGQGGHGYNKSPERQRDRNRTTRDRSMSPLTAAAAGGLTAGVAAGIAASRMNDERQTSQNQNAKAAYTGYVPYADVYGGTKTNESQSNISSPQPDTRNQMGPTRRDAPSDYSDRLRPDVRRSRPYEESYNDGNDSERGRRDPRARSYDSYDSRDDYRNPRREDHRDDRWNRGKSSSRLGETFDASQRGLGYGAVGALAGSLVGSGIGKGPKAGAIGAVLGGLGANMFEARERRKDSARMSEYARDESITARREQRETEKREKHGGAWND